MVNPGINSEVKNGRGSGGENPKSEEVQLLKKLLQHLFAPVFFCYSIPFLHTNHNLLRASEPRPSENCRTSRCTGVMKL